MLLLSSWHSHVPCKKNKLMHTWLGTLAYKKKASWSLGPTSFCKSTSNKNNSNPTFH